jgi:tetratricopeptide (TPR) repeat protein
MGIYFPILALLCLSLFAATSSPTFGFIDSGELATVIQTCGIAHPTGYPLYTIIGRSISLFFFSTTLIRCLNLFSGLLVTGASIAFAGTLRAEFRRHSLHCIRYRTFLCIPASGDAPSEKHIAGMMVVCASLIFPSAILPWRQAVITEVYPLSTAIFAVLLLLARMSIFQEKGSPGIRNRALLLLAFALGASFGNHYFAPVSVIPGIIVFSLTSCTVRKFAQRNMMTLILLFSLGLSLILYLPVRAHLDPVFNWGDPEIMGSLFRHISGKQYQVWMFQTHFEGFLENVKTHFTAVVNGQVPRIFLLFFIAGIWILLKYSKRFLFFLISIVLTNLLYVSNYDISDIEPYRTPSVFTCLFITSIGITFMGRALLHTLRRCTKERRWPVIGVCIAVMLLPSVSTVCTNFTLCNRRTHYYAYDFAYNAMKQLPPGSIVLTDVWFFHSPSLYLRFVDNFRKDLIIIDTELLRRRWYVTLLKSYYSGITRRSKGEIDRYLQELCKYESGSSYDPSSLQRNYIRLIESFILHNEGDRAAFAIMVDGRNGFLPGWRRIPHGYITRIVPPDATVEADYSLFDAGVIRNLRDPSIHRSPQDEVMCARVLSAPFRYGLHYLKETRDYERALSCFEDSIRLNPSDVPSLRNAAVAALLMNEEETSLDYMSRAISLEPDNDALRRDLSTMRNLMKRRRKAHGEDTEAGE